VTLLSLVPTQLGRLLALEPLWEPPRHLRALLLGGAAAPVALLDAARARGVPVLTTYGLTEACSQVATQAPGTPCSAAEGAGRPLPGIGVRVVDGEIQVRGPTLPSGYVGGDPPPLTADGWLRTGDRGWLDAEGRLHVLGRAGDVIVTGGEKVHPLEVERVLEAFAGVTAACAVGVRDPVWGQRVVALVVAQAGSNLDLADLWRWTREKLATFKRPRRMALVGELPLSPGGKLDRAAAARIASCLGDSDFFEHQA
jgi:O-succinylbenzoic acid--CoA ligase